MNSEPIIASTSIRFDSSNQEYINHIFSEEERRRKEEQKEAMLYRLGHRHRTYQLERLGRVGRNEKCPCGSGVKFKVCCMRRSAE